MKNSGIVRLLLILGFLLFIFSFYQVFFVNDFNTFENRAVEISTTEKVQDSNPNYEEVTANINLNPTEIVGEIAANTAIFDLLVNKGVSSEETLALINSFRGIFDFRLSKPGDTFYAKLLPDSHISYFKYTAGPIDIYEAHLTTQNVFVAAKKNILVEKKIIAKTFTIETSLFDAVLQEGEAAYLVMEFADIFSWDIDFYLYPQKGDKIRILFEKYFTKKGFLKYGNILFAEYDSARKRFQAFRFASRGSAAFYDEHGYPLRKMFLRQPLKFGVKTSGFTIRRFHPILKRVRPHTGIDYGAAIGTPIRATAKGVVSHATWWGGYGKLVVIRHPNNYKTYYGHCQKVLVRNGQYVDQGQVIALVGSTGRSTGPHVHYEVRINNKPVNPETLKSVRANPLYGQDRIKFKSMSKNYLAKADSLLNPPLPVVKAEQEPVAAPIVMEKSNSFWLKIKRLFTNS